MKLRDLIDFLRLTSRVHGEDHEVSFITTNGVPCDVDDITVGEADVVFTLKEVE